MRTLVVYDSYFGNTEKIAQAVGAALSTRATVEVVRASNLRADQVQGVELLIVGSPTRAFQASEAIKAFLKNLPAQSLQGVRVAAFDTRVDVSVVNSKVLTFLVKLFGYAAEPMAKGLQRKGGQMVGTPAGFIVRDREGPLEEGELERAAEWAAALA